MNKRLLHEQQKDDFNWCSRCLATKIQDIYFIKDKQLCQCCEDILKGGEKQCYVCKEQKSIELFEQPYLIKCKVCAAKRIAEKVECSCGKVFSQGTLSKHKNKCGTIKCPINLC